MNEALPYQNASQPGVKTVKLWIYYVNLPAETTNNTIGDLSDFLSNLDPQKSTPKFKEALQIQRSPEEQLDFLQGLHDALDSGNAAGETEATSRISTLQFWISSSTLTSERNGPTRESARVGTTRVWLLGCQQPVSSLRLV